jgi:hypothetical protein
VSQVPSSLSASTPARERGSTLHKKTLFFRPIPLGTGYEPALFPFQH